MKNSHKKSFPLYDCTREINFHKNIQFLSNYTLINNTNNILFNHIFEYILFY